MQKTAIKAKVYPGDVYSSEYLTPDKILAAINLARSRMIVSTRHHSPSAERAKDECDQSKIGE
jgi:hypothetical protein